MIDSGLKETKDTKERILDTAERLLGSQGIAATSLRQIIGEAGVNLAAIHYHFRSKEMLLEAVLMRRMGDVNRERVEMLDAAEANGRTATLEEILDAFLRPPMRLSRDPEKRYFVELMGRTMAEDSQFLARLARRYFQPMISRFARAVNLALTHLSQEERFWRLYFSLGAMCFAVQGHLVDAITEGRCDSRDVDGTLNHLVRFLAAGLRAGEADAVRAQDRERTHVPT